MSGSLSARFVYSHGSTSMLKRHGPDSSVHSLGLAGCSPLHVTTAFLRVWELVELCVFASAPGGRYHLSRDVAEQRMELVMRGKASDKAQFELNCI